MTRCCMCVSLNSVEFVERTRSNSQVCVYMYMCISLFPFLLFQTYSSCPVVPTSKRLLTTGTYINVHLQIPAHILKCKPCAPEVKAALLELKVGLFSFLLLVVVFVSRVSNTQSLAHN
jgi:hypothetical protein